MGFISAGKSNWLKAGPVMLYALVLKHLAISKTPIKSLLLLFCCPNYFLSGARFSDYFFSNVHKFGVSLNKVTLWS